MNEDYRRKIVSLERLRKIIADFRRPDSGRTLVQCHGCFDIVHPGHIRYLQFARTQGDMLIVSITGDAEIDKGVQRPYIPQELRAENLAALEFVDYVVIDPNPTACDLLRAIRPDVYVKGQEYATSSDPGFLAEREVVETAGGKVVFSSGQVVFSSSRLLESMPRSDDLAAERLVCVCRRHGMDESSLGDCLAAMRGKRVLVLGDALVDRYVICDASDVAVESPMMELREIDTRDYVGGAARVALQAAQLGAETELVTALGDDDAADWLSERLHAAGVRVEGPRRRGATAQSTRFVVDDHKLFKVNRTEVAPLDSVQERHVADLLLDAAARGDAAIVFDCGFGLITPGLLRRLGGTFRGRVPLLAGACAEPDGSLRGLRELDLVCLGERQIRAAMNDFASGLSTVAYRMLQSLDARQLVATLGKRGLVTFDRASSDRTSPAWNDRLRSEHLQSFVPRAGDGLGATEALLSVATLALACGASLMSAAYLGALAVAVQAAGAGAEPVGAGSLRDALRRRPELACDEEEIPPARAAAHRGAQADAVAL